MGMKGAAKGVKLMELESFGDGWQLLLWQTQHNAELSNPYLVHLKLT